jgi:HlyD family secretion protein
MKPNNIKKIILVIASLSFVLAACSPEAATSTPELEAELAAFSPGVSATGEIVPELHASLSISAAGVIEEVMIEEGTLVSEGDVLIQLEGGEQARAAVAAANVELINAQNALDTLNDNASIVSANALKLAENLEDQLEDLLNRELQEALALQAIADAEKLIEDTQRTYDGTIQTADENDIDAQRAQVTLAKDALDDAIEDYEPYEDKPEDNLTRAVFLQKKAAAQNVYDEAVRILNYMLGTGTAADIAVADADVNAASAQLIEAQRDWERVQEGPNPGEVALLEAQIEQAYEDYENSKDGPDPADLAAAQARLANAEAQFAAAESALEDLQLLAPFNGTISEVNVNTSEWVSPGQPVIVIADLNHLQVETTDLSEIDVAKVSVGDIVTITFDALPDRIEGTVASISPKAAAGSGVNYTVVIDMTDTPDGLRWGMTAFVEVESE